MNFSLKESGPYNKGKRMSDEKKWIPRYVKTEGNSGDDCVDLFESGITGDKYLAWLKENMVEGRPVIHPKKPKPKPKPTPNPAPEPVAEPASNVVALRKPVEETDYGIPPEFSEDALAEQFTKTYSETMKFCGPADCWYIWWNGKWIKDETAVAVDRARKICKLASADVMLKVALTPSKAERVSNAISSRRMFSNIEQIARTDRQHVVSPTKFDSRPYLLNTPGGIVELKTGELRPGRKDDFCTLTTSVTPDGEMNCPRWLSFLDDATNHDPELILYLQRIAGYALTGAVTEHAFFFCYGGGGNGKGTYVNTLDFLLGTYSKVAQMDTFTESRFSKHSTELAFLQGARLVTAQELDAGARWNETRIKTLTGGDPITARHMYQSEFTYYPTFKLLFSGNNKPIIKNVDAAMRRRMYLIPFEYEVPEDKIDGKLQAHLKEVEGPGILQWAIEGCLDWQLNTLNPPERVMLTTNEYFEDEDRIAAFFIECCDQGTGLRELTTRLYNRYRDWCESNGEYPVSRKNFLSSIARKGFRSKNLGGQMSIEGVHVPDTWMAG